MLGAALGTVSRFKVADFTASWSEGPYYCVVPYPKKEYNAVASLEPLSFQVRSLYDKANESQMI